MVLRSDHGQGAEIKANGQPCRLCFYAVSKRATSQSSKPSRVAGQLLRKCSTLITNGSEFFSDWRRRRGHDPRGADLGCVMENLWLAAEAVGIAMQVLSVFSSGM